MKIAIIDLDGPVANNEARFERARAVGQQKGVLIDWDVAFTPALVSLDTPVPGAVEALDFMERKGYALYFLTSRPEFMRAATGTWLKQHGFWRSGRELIMKDYVVDRYTNTPTWKAQRVMDFIHSVAVGEILFIDDEEKNRKAVEALGFGVICKADLSDYMNPDEPIIV